MRRNPYDVAGGRAIALTNLVLNNRYELGQPLGQGGMARVYLARDRFLTRQVAVKILHPALNGDKRFLARFRREAEAAAKLTHPHIVSVYDVGSDGDLNYIIMEYVPGMDLKELLLQSGPLPPRRVVDIGAQVASALQYAHARQLIHRDIKPHNVMVTPSGLVKVADFGIATVLGDITQPDEQINLGAAQYFSPEQAQGFPVTPRTDIYSLGVVLYEAATGFLPFPGDNAVAVARGHVQDAPVPPSTLHTDVTPELERVIMRALAKNPRDRFASAEEIARALQALERTPEPAHAGVDRRAMRTRPARRATAAGRGSGCVTRLIGVLVLAFVVGMPLAFWRLNGEDLPTVLAPEPSPTVQAVPTKPPAPTVPPTSTSTPTPIPTARATSTPTPTATPPPRPTFGKTPTPTPSPSPTPTSTPTPRPTATPTPTPTPRPTNTPTPEDAEGDRADGGTELPAAIATFLAESERRDRR